MSVKYLLWDSSVVIPYYVKEATRNGKVAGRSRTVLEAVRHHRVDAFCYIPNIVIAEVFVALDRHCYSAWDKQVNNVWKPAKTLDSRRYKTVRKKFRQDIHNGKLFYQVETNRYHILGIDLLAPVDKFLSEP